MISELIIKLDAPVCRCAPPVFKNIEIDVKTQSLIVSCATCGSSVSRLVSNIQGKIETPAAVLSDAASDTKESAK